MAPRLAEYDVRDRSPTSSCTAGPACRAALFGAERSVVVRVDEWWRQHRAAAGGGGFAAEKEHVVLFSINPIYRGGTIGTYPLVFNPIRHFDNLNAGRTLDAK